MTIPHRWVHQRTAPFAVPHGTPPPCDWASEMEGAQPVAVQHRVEASCVACRMVTGLFYLWRAWDDSWHYVGCIGHPCRGKDET